MAVMLAGCGENETHLSRCTLEAMSHDPDQVPCALSIIDVFFVLLVCVGWWPLPLLEQSFVGTKEAATAPCERVEITMILYFNITYMVNY